MFNFFLSSFKFISKFILENTIWYSLLMASCGAKHLAIGNKKVSKAHTMMPKRPK